MGRGSHDHCLAFNHTSTRRSIDLWECQDWVVQRVSELMDALGARLATLDSENGLIRHMVVSVGMS